jgi:hypothetical protein
MLQVATFHPLEDVHKSIRSETAPCEPADEFPDEDQALLLEMVNAGYRALSLRLHPDRGGSHEAMQRLNRLVNKLRRGLLPA